MGGPEQEAVWTEHRHRLWALAESANETARMARVNVSLTLVAALYLTLTLLTATDENIVRNTVVTLPQLGTGVSLKISYIFAPVVFVYLHAQTLFLLVVLARKVRRFEETRQLAFPDNQEAAAECRNWLSAVSLVQGLLGTGGFTRLARGFTWFGTAGVPLVLLFLIDVSFLRHQSGLTSLIHHVCFSADLAGVWIFWRHVGSPPTLFRWRSVLEIFRSRSQADRVSELETFLRTVRNLVAKGVAFALVALLWIYGWPIEHDADFPRGAPDTSFHVLDDVLCPDLRWRGVCRTLNLTGANLRGADMQGAILLKANVRRADLREASLRGADLRGADLREARLLHADMDRADLRGADLRNTDLRDTKLANVDLRDARLQGADLQNAELRRAAMERATLLRADLRLARLEGVNLQNADLRRAILQDSTLLRANLREANLQGAVLQGADLRDVALQNAKMRRAIFRGAILRGASLQEANLQHADLRDADLTRADLQEAILQDITARRANLSEANLRNADLRNADFQDASLRMVDLRRTILQAADLRGADLVDADMQGANLRGADLRGANLQGAKGLTQSQLMQACGNQRTMLPAELTTPDCPG